MWPYGWLVIPPELPSLSLGISLLLSVTCLPGDPALMTVFLARVVPGRTFPGVSRSVSQKCRGEGSGVPQGRNST